MPKLSTTVPGGAALFQRVYTRLNCEGRPPRFHVDFYPYKSLTLTIRRREETVFVRFSDLLQRAPLRISITPALIRPARASTACGAHAFALPRSHKAATSISTNCSMN